MKKSQISKLKFEIARVVTVVFVCGFATTRAEAFTQLSPSNLLKNGEGMVGVDAGLIREKVTLTGAFGTGAARSKYPLEAMTIGGVGGYGFTDRLDGFLRIGGAFSPTAFGKDKRASGLAGGAGVRCMLVGGRSAEIGAFAIADFLSVTSNEANLTVGTVKTAGSLEIRNVGSLTLGIGPQWWWRIGAQKFLFPSLAAFVQPRLIGTGLFTQSGVEGAAPRELSGVDAGMSPFVGFAAGLGLDLRTVLIKVGARWFGAAGGGLSVEAPF